MIINFNSKNMYYGCLCSKNHDNKDGMSIRYINSHNCVQCHKEYYKNKQQIKDNFKIQKLIQQNTLNLLNINYLELFNENLHFFGSLCFRGHNHKNEQSIRYKNNRGCIQCAKEIKETNIQTIKEREKKYKQTHKEQIKDYNFSRKEIKKEEYEKNKEKRLKQGQEYYQINLEKIKEYKKKPEVKERANFLKKQKLSTDLNYKLNNLIRSALWYSLKHNKQNRHWEDLIDFNLEQLKQYLQINEFKDLQNKHIDHIIPQSWFKFKTFNDEEFKLCWSLKNLQLLEKSENISKLNYYVGNPYNKFLNFEEFKELKEKFNITIVCNSIWNYYLKSKNNAELL